MPIKSIIGQQLFGGVAAILIALAQSYFLHHELAECYPYKILPSAELYVQAANFASWAGPILVAIVALALLKVRSFWWYAFFCIALAALLCPGIYILAYRIHTLPIIPNLVSPDFSTQTAWFEFRESAITKATSGFIGAACFFVLLSVTQIRHAPQRA